MKTVELKSRLRLLRWCWKCIEIWDDWRRRRGKDGTSIYTSSESEEEDDEEEVLLNYNQNLRWETAYKKAKAETAVEEMKKERSDLLLTWQAKCKMPNYYYYLVGF